jgi:hypothetical protein
MTERYYLGVLQRHKLFDQIFIFYIFLLPFIPRPTLKYPEWAWIIAPAVTGVLLYFFILWFFHAKVELVNSMRRYRFLLLSQAVILLIYFSRTIYFREVEEIPRVVSRLLMFVVMFALLIWLLEDEIDIKIVFRALYFSILILAVLAIYIGVTGVALFGLVSPARTFGDAVMPFAKTAVIPRSYGEFGIFLSVAWAYFLMYTSDQNKIFRAVSGVLLTLAVVITQSRSTYLAIFFITASYPFITRVRSRPIIYLIMVIVIFSPAIIYNIMDFFVVKFFVGHGVLQNNVMARFYTYYMFFKVMTKEPIEFFFGLQRSDWSYFMEDSYGKLVGLHNKFLSGLLFLGVIGGTLDIAVFFLPFFNLIRRRQEKICQLLLLVNIGMITCLNYYEGFFSLISSVIIAASWYVFRGGNKEIINCGSARIRVF